MKIVLTGGAGNITQPLAIALLAEGHEVKVIGRNADNLSVLQSKGAIPLIGSIEDEAFLVQAFESADVVYTMSPMPLHYSDWVEYGRMLGGKYAKAIASNNIKKVVNLSTFGAHRLEGVGPAHSLGQIEKALDSLENTTVTHIRAGYFYSNLVNQIPAIKQDGIIGANFGDAKNLMLLVHTDDIAKVVAEAITTPLFNDCQPFYVVGDIRTYEEVASVLGRAIGKNLQWSVFTDEQVRDTLTQNGVPESFVNIFLEIGQGMASGVLNEHYFSLTSKPTLSETKLEVYAEEFRALYNR